MEEIKNELRSVALEIVQMSSNNTNKWLKKTSELYEKLLVLKYLDDREEHLNEIRKKVESNLGSITHKPIEVKAKEEKQTAEVPNLSYQSEIRVVPHPEGPPKSKPIESAPEAASRKVESPSTHEATNRQSIAEKAASTKKRSLNDSLSNQTIKFGLNDRIAFVKHLFNGSQEDFNRVVSQLNSFDSMEEAKQFINHIVKPEYSWNGKSDFEERFMAIIESRFES